MVQPNRSNMTPVWYKLLKIVLLLFALFITIVLINNEITKRREAEAAAAAAIAAKAQSITDFISDDLMNIMRNRTQGVGPAGTAGPSEPIEQPQQHQRRQEPDNQTKLSAENIDDRIRSTFVLREGKGVLLFGQTKQQQRQPAHRQQSQLQQHQEPSSSSLQLQAQHDQQAFKVQRSPDGKLNLVFNDPIVSLQPNGAPSAKPRQPSSDSKLRPTKRTSIDTDLHNCADGYNISSSFCTKVNNYPDLSGLSDILEREFASYFTNDPEPTELGTRIDTGEQYLCKGVVKYLYPQSGRAADNTMQYIVNSDKFKQAVLVEECEQEGNKCEFMGSLANNYVSFCKQHYTLRQMVIINNGSGIKPETKSIPIPSCCKCVIKDKSYDADSYS